MVLGIFVLVGDQDPTAFFVIEQLDGSAVLGEQRLALRSTCLEELDHAGQTVSDVLTGNATGVERTHGQLRAGFTD